MAEALRLTIVGMAAVFAFLAILVIMMRASATFFSSFGDRFADATPPPLRADRPQAAVADIAAVIAIAERERSGGL